MLQSPGNLTGIALMTLASVSDPGQVRVTADDAIPVLFDRYANDVVYPLPWDQTKMRDRSKFYLLKRAFQSAVKCYVKSVVRTEAGQEILPYKVVKATVP
jgi:hypothetical protein